MRTIGGDEGALKCPNWSSNVRDKNRWARDLTGARKDTVLMRKFCSCFISDIALIGSTEDMQMETKFTLQRLTTMMTQGFKLIAVRQNLSFG